MTYVLLCKSCKDTNKCNLQNGFIDLCPKIISHKISEIKKIIANRSNNKDKWNWNNKTVQKDSKQLRITKQSCIKQIDSSSTEKLDRQKNEKRILKDIEKGRGGPDIAGLNKMYGSLYRSLLAKKAKERLTGSF